MIPAADIGERDPPSEIRLDQLSELLEAVAEASVKIVGAGCRLVLARIGGLQHLYCIEGFLSGAVQNGIHRVLIHGFECVGGWCGFGIAPTHAEVVDVVHGDSTLTP